MRFGFLLCVLSALVAFHLCHSIEGAVFVREMTCAQGDNCSLETAERVVIYETTQCLPIMGMPSSALVRLTANDSTFTLCVFPNSTTCEGNPLCSVPLANDTLVTGDLFPEPLRRDSTQYVKLLWWNDREERWGSPELEKLVATPDEHTRTPAERHGTCAFDHTQYGRWCGSGHGGLQDCCNGKPCSTCSYETDDVSMSCQRQCRPADLLDLACAYHDVCTFRYDLAELFPGSRCSYNLVPIFYTVDQANYCECDCKLMKAMRRALCPPQWYDICQHQKSCQAWLFGEAAACWYYDGQGPVCNHGSQKISIWRFCD